MSSEFDGTEFVDSDLQAARKSSYAAASASPFAATDGRAPTREEVDYKVGETQQKLAELKRAQEELERERAGLEETRRRQMEFQTGRQEILQNLTRGLGLLEEAEFNARRDAEQMAKSLVEMRDALSKVETIREEAWTKENFNLELTRALTIIENARMEWNTARLKFPVLCSAPKDEGAALPGRDAPAQSPLGTGSFGELCRLGLALTWPLAVIGLLALGILVAVLLSR
jgi:hypothetical protein